MKSGLKSILLVEDEPDIQEISRLSLENIGGFTVYLCNNGLDAYEKALEIKPDLIMWDVMMPVMDGLTALKLIQTNSKLSEIPVIFMSAKVQPHEIKDYMSKGAAGVIRKPFDPLKLPEEINTIWKAIP